MNIIRKLGLAPKTKHPWLPQYVSSQQEFSNYTAKHQKN